MLWKLRYLSPSKQISPIAPKLPMRLSFIISSRFPLFQPPQMPSHVSASPSRCIAPVIAIYTTMTNASVIRGGKKKWDKRYAMHRQIPIHKPTTGNQQTTEPKSFGFIVSSLSIGMMVRNLSAHKKLFILLNQENAVTVLRSLNLKVWVTDYSFSYQCITKAQEFKIFISAIS